MPSALDQLATVRSRSAPVAGDDGFQDSVHFRVQVWGRVRERAGIDDEDLARNIDTVALQVESPDEVAFTGALVHTSACFGAPSSATGPEYTPTGRVATAPSGSRPYPPSALGRSARWRCG